MENLIGEMTEIQVHFNDYLNPNKLQYSTVIKDRVISLGDHPCNSNDLKEIKEIAVSDMREVRSPEYEHFHTYTFDVLNKDFPNPFTDEDIPEIYFELGLIKT